MVRITLSPAFSWPEVTSVNVEAGDQLGCTRQRDLEVLVREREILPGEFEALLRQPRLKIVVSDSATIDIRALARS